MYTYYQHTTDPGEAPSLADGSGREQIDRYRRKGTTNNPVSVVERVDEECQVSWQVG